jgi:hypothetical protein
MDAEDRMDPFTKETLFSFILESSDDIQTFVDDLNKKNRYIEAQLWNDSYLVEALKK